MKLLKSLDKNDDDYEKKDKDTGETIVLKRTTFDTIYLCYKMNLPRDMLWL